MIAFEYEGVRGGGGGFRRERSKRVYRFECDCTISHSEIGCCIGIDVYPFELAKCFDESESRV